MQPLTGDPFWDDMDFSLPFDDRLLLPNSPSLIHEGVFKIRANSSESVLVLTGKIEQRWLPTPQVRYVGISGETGQNIFSLLSKEMQSWSNGLHFNCTISHIAKLSSGIECSGSVKGLLLKGADMPIDELRFSIVNFPAFLGLKVKNIDENTGHRYSLESLTLNGDGWTLRIHQRFKADDLLCEVGAKGGYISTHSCSLRRSDGEHFEYSTALGMIECLTYFFGFLAGRWCGPVLPIGIMKESRRWELYGSHLVSPTLTGDSWFPLLYTLDIVDLFSGFLAHWKSEVWTDPLKQAVHWIVAANTSQNEIEASIVAAFVPIEMLCWLILVESSNHYSIKQFKKEFGDADAKMSELLRASNIPNVLPCYLHSLHGTQFEQVNPTASSALVQIRNAITHPRQTKREFLRNISRPARYQAKELCLEFVELVLLMSMGYGGRYRRRAFGGWSGKEYANVPWSNMR